MPKARIPRTWVTVLASHPSVSIETLTTQRTCSPSLPGLPTVFMTSRSRSSSVRLSASRPGKRARYSDLNSSISRRAILLEVRAHRLAGFQLLAVDQDRDRAGLPSAIVDVGKQCELAGNECRRVVSQLRSQPPM